MAGFNLPIQAIPPQLLAEMARAAFKPPALMSAGGMGGGGGGGMQMPQSPGFNLGQGIASMGQGLGMLAGALGSDVSSSTPAAGTQLGGGEAGGLTTVGPGGVYSVTGLQDGGASTGMTPVDPQGGGWWARNFGGGRADGGEVMPGQYYTVGERGPETFVPAVPGYIVPNDPYSAVRPSEGRYIDNYAPPSGGRYIDNYAPPSGGRYADDPYSAVRPSERDFFGGRRGRR